jgi:anti-anti-sigma regulatory factor
VILWCSRSGRTNDGLLPVTADSPILVGVFDGFSWIRFEGKGSFINSPAVKAFGDSRIAAGETRMVVDLAGCTGMDSTFMGTLAGMAARLSAQESGGLQIAEPGERNRRSLEDLGLDFLMEIDPPDAAWRGRVDQIRRELHEPRMPGAFGRAQRARHVLEAHQALAEINDGNAGEFAGVISQLEKDLAENSSKERLAESDGNA